MEFEDRIIFLRIDTKTLDSYFDYISRENAHHPIPNRLIQVNRPLGEISPNLPILVLTNKEGYYSL